MLSKDLVRIGGMGGLNGYCGGWIHGKKEEEGADLIVTFSRKSPE